MAHIKADKNQALQKLTFLKSEIASLQRLANSDAPEFKKWHRNTEVAITNIFGGTARNLGDFRKIRFSLSIATSLTTEADWREAYLRGLGTAEAVLQSMIEEVVEYWPGDVPEKHIPPSVTPSASHRVFVVHGHDDGLKNEVARFLEKLDLEPIVLHEQSNSGQTIIEKFENHADVGFAVVLLTPDDTCSSSKGRENVARFRARQNVIFEFGYFIGRLGRHRVCGILKGDVDVPSDYSGVVYVPVDNGGAWKYLLVKELKSAGMNVDANRAI
jgi:predicted nucleotide-binding protein